MSKLTDKLLKLKEPVSILECRSGWRVYLKIKSDKVFLASSAYCNNDFNKMIITALNNYKNNIDGNGNYFENN